jgi:hypothetical protein
VMLFLLLFPLRQAFFHSVREDTMEITRLKGMESGLYVYRKKNSGVEILKDGSSAAAGDLLQMSYISTEDSYGVILSIDGRGTVTLHYPRNLGAEPKLKTNSKVILPYAYELDDAPDFERFFLILSPSIIDVKEVMHAAELLARSPGRSRKEKIQLDESVTQISVLIVKGK